MFVEAVCFASSLTCRHAKGLAAPRALVNSARLSSKRVLAASVPAINWKAGIFRTRYSVHVGVVKSQLSARQDFVQACPNSWMTTSART